MRHIVGISGGKDSVAMALRLREVEPRDYQYLITPTGNELPEMFEHWKRLESLLGKPLVRLGPHKEGDGLVQLIDRMNALPNWRQRWCTRILKIEPTIAYLKENAPCVQYVGLRADEEAREGIYGRFEGVEQRYPLREWGWGIDDVWGYLAERGVKIPQRTDCAWCFGQRLIEWKRLLENSPHVYQAGIEIEKKTGHTFRSPGRDTWPASLEELREALASGRRVRGDKRQLPSDMHQMEEEDGACRVCKM